VSREGETEGGRARQGRIAVEVLKRSKGGEPEEGGRSSQSQARSERANAGESAVKVTFCGHVSAQSGGRILP
jgi:hypothetical protein